MQLKKLSTLLLMTIGLSSCAMIAVMTAPKKLRSTVRTELANKADEFFWTHFRAGNYQKLDDILGNLKSAYRADPHDAITAMHLGFAHAWRYAERSRLLSEPSSLIDDPELARFYFAEANKLYPRDARVAGFLAHMTMVSGVLHEDEKRIREGYFGGLDAIRSWPEFNYFAVGYALSNNDADDERFKEALRWMWKNLDECSEQSIDKTNLDLSEHWNDEERDRKNRKKSVCWNSWIAPYNVQGFLLNLGDMLLKSGDKNAAIAVYKNARSSRNYQEWPYHHVVEQRLLLTRDARQGFANQYAPSPMMVNSSFSCMACHQAQ